MTKGLPPKYLIIYSISYSKRYINVHDYTQIKLLPSLSFVPPNDVVRAFEILTAGEYLDGQIGQLIDYFEDTWIGRRRGNDRRRGTFPIELWNCYDAIREGIRV